MQTGAITSYFDVAQIALYAFWIFFAGLVFYLRREDKREGYPLVPDGRSRRPVEGFPPMPTSKTYLLPHGGTRTAPSEPGPEPAFKAEPVAPWPGAPLQPIGEAMTSGAGPAAYALRADQPDLTFATGEPRVVPLRVASDHYVDPEGPDPRNMEVLGADGVTAGVVSDLWIDVAEITVRYLEVTLAAGLSVLLPMPLARVDAASRRVIVDSITGAQFAGVPLRTNPDKVTLREEDRIAAYYAGGKLFAEPRRMESLL